MSLKFFDISENITPYPVAIVNANLMDIMIFTIDILMEIYRRHKIPILPITNSQYKICYDDSVRHNYSIIKR